MEHQGLRAEDLGTLLGTSILDVDDAAAYLGLVRGSLWQAMFRYRIPYVQYGRYRYFAVGDLDDYMRLRHRGRASEIDYVRPLEVVTVKGARTVRRIPWPRFYEP